METKLLDLINKTDFQKVLNNKNYTFFENGNYNLNIIGVRNLFDASEKNNIISINQTDKFNDALVLLYKDNGEWKKDIYEITTDPGLKLLRNPSNSKGTAILVPGQYRNTYKIDLHKGQYKALCQRGGLVKVYRDKNKDNKLDFDPKTIDTGYFGINIHKAGLSSELIGGYSAGCQVFHYVKDFNKFMENIEKSNNIYGNSFTYTLLTTNDLL